jgi:hypothetical protein
METSATSSEVGDGWLALLREQAGLYEKLERCAVHQRSLIAAEDAAPLLALLVDRRRLSSRLAEIAARLALVRDDWTGHRGRLPSSEQAEADRLWNDSRARLRRLLDGDERDLRLLAARREAVNTAMRRLRSTGEAVAAYSAALRPAPRAGRLDKAT